MLSEAQIDGKRRTAEAMLAAFPLPEGEAPWARDARARARARLLDSGAPIRRDEYWRMTDPTALTEPAAPLAPAGTVERVDAFPGIPARRLAFVNGRFRCDLSDDATQEGLEVLALREALSTDISFARDLFGRLEAAGQEKVDRPLAALNTAAATEGLALRVTGEVAEPLHLRHDQIGEGAALVHHVIRLETGAHLTLIESGTPGNAVMEVDLAPGARLDHVRIDEGAERPSVSHVFARIAAGAAFKTFALVANGRLTRTETVIDLVGDAASGHIAGAVLGGADSHTDNTVFVTHSGVGCESRQVFKSVLAETGRSVFQGKIFVREGAQKTDGYQISQSVLLSEGAEFNAKPELEIYADDVQCSHGSTTGALDRTALFYLMSRGVPRREAEALLVASFVEEAIGEISDEAMAERMRAAVAGWMATRA